MFHPASLRIDPERTAARLAGRIRDGLRDELRRSGAVIGISGGVDSAVVAALCTRALGPDRVLGVALPEHESESASTELANVLARRFGFELVTREISAALQGLDCYAARNRAIRQVFPHFEEGWSARITNPGCILDKSTLNFFRLTVRDPKGREFQARLPRSAYLEIVAASNLKQRTRMTALYHEAERRNFAVIGTANRDEYGQGFFVKYGDGGADLHPIVRLFKTQVFELGRFLGVPDAILDRLPTTDTYPDEVSQEEFFYGLDFERMDLITWGMETGVPPAEVAAALELETAQIERAFENIAGKRRATAYLRSQPPGIVGQELVTPLDPVLHDTAAADRGS